VPGVIENVTARADGRDVADARDPQQSAPPITLRSGACACSNNLTEGHMVGFVANGVFTKGCLPMVLCRDWQVSGLLEQPPKFRLRSEAHGSIRVQEGTPSVR
jgi:hypothetical protein